MEMIKRFEPVALLFMVLGALNWGILGLFEENVISNVFGTGTFTDVLYIVVGAQRPGLHPEAARGLPPRRARAAPARHLTDTGTTGGAVEATEPGPRARLR